MSSKPTIVVAQVPLEREIRSWNILLLVMWLRDRSQWRKPEKICRKNPWRFPGVQGIKKITPTKKSPGKTPGAFIIFYLNLKTDGVPKGIRTPVAGVKGRCPGPG